MKSASLFAVLVGATTSNAFSASSEHHHRSIIRPSTAAAITGTSSSTALYGKRRGGLGNNVSLDEDGNVKLISNKQKQKLGNSKGSRKGNKRGKGNTGGGSDDATISPLLAEWAKEDGDGGATSSPKTKSSARSAVTSSSSSDVFVSFESGNNKKKKKNKRNNNNKSKQLVTMSAEQTSQMDELLERITEMLGTTNCNVSELVSNIASLADLNASFSNDQVLLPTLKSILSTRPPRSSYTASAKDDGDEESKKKNQQPSYRLAWVGSDSAICHVGTSLHKVPLARLQEMYLLLGYGRWELLEVIRILGPFPNVRNTLKGDIKVEKIRGSMREGAKLEISYLSMIDGTGKEILAGKEDNVKVVELDVWFANEKAIVCSVPKDGEDDPLSGDGSNVLFFVAEENLDEELEKLRAA